MGLRVERVGADDRWGGGIDRLGERGGGWDMEWEVKPWDFQGRE